MTTKLNFLDNKKIKLAKDVIIMAGLIGEIKSKKDINFKSIFINFREQVGGYG